jgi:hypothetical protein
MTLSSQLHNSATHGINEDDARHIAWCALLASERVQVQACDFATCELK